MKRGKLENFEKKIHFRSIQDGRQAKVQKVAYVGFRPSALTRMEQDM